MTGEFLPAGDSPGPGAEPELRASHADRDRVVEVLRVAAGDGLLTAAELDEQDTLRIDVDLGIGGDLTLVTRPGIVVDTDDLSGRLGEIRVRDVTDPHAPVILRVELAGRVRGGGVVARLPRRTFWQWLLRKPRPYRSRAAG